MIRRYFIEGYHRETKDKSVFMVYSNSSRNAYLKHQSWFPDYVPYTFISAGGVLEFILDVNKFELKLERSFKELIIYGRTTIKL